MEELVKRVVRIAATVGPVLVSSSIFSSLPFTGLKQHTAFVYLVVQGHGGPFWPTTTTSS